MPVVPNADSNAPAPLAPTPAPRTHARLRYRFAGAWRCALRLVDASGTVRVATATLEVRDEGGTLLGWARPAAPGAEGLDGPVRGCRLDDELVVCVPDVLNRALWVLEGRWADGRVTGRATRACRSPGGLARAEGVFELERVS